MSGVSRRMWIARFTALALLPSLLTLTALNVQIRRSTAREAGHSSAGYVTRIGLENRSENSYEAVDSRGRESSITRARAPRAMPYRWPFQCQRIRACNDRSEPVTAVPE